MRGVACPILDFHIPAPNLARRRAVTSPGYRPTLKPSLFLFLKILSIKRKHTHITVELTLFKRWTR